MALSEFAVRKAKPREKAYKLFDGGGLFLHVQPNGSKHWRLKYRYDGKEKLLSFGPFPAISIADARIQRERTKEKLAKGSDPAVQKKLDRIAVQTASRQTFGLIAQEYVQRMEASGAAPATLSKTRWLLEKLAAPISERSATEITSAEILDMLRKIELSGRLETARRLRGVIGSVFRYAIVTLRATSDPTIALHGALLAPKVIARAAITDEAKLGALLVAVDEYDGWPTISAALKLLILTCVRPGEVRGAKRAEFDLEEAIWRIPEGRMTMRRPHDVPLSRQALAVLNRIWPLSEGSELVFPSIRSKHRPLSDAAFNAALRRMGFTKEEVTAHGFRVTASTLLNSLGYDPDVIEAVLAHRDRNEIRRACNRSSNWEQRIELMQQWADLLDEFKAKSN